MPLSPPYRFAYDVPLVDSAWKLCKDLGMNIVYAPCILHLTPAQIDYIWVLATKYDMYVVLWALFTPSERERLITPLKDEPYLWAWYLYDEPGCNGVVAKQRQINCYNEIKGYDPNHLIATSFGEGETYYAYEPKAFDIMLAYGIYPCAKSDPMQYLYAKLVVLGRVKYIQDAISKGKIWMPILHTWQKISEWCWCDRCETIDSSAHPEYNGMEGVRAMYEMYKNEVGTAPDGASFYHYLDFSKSHSCNAVMRQQIKNLNYEVLGAVSPAPPLPPPPTYAKSRMVCQKCGSTLELTLSSLSIENKALNCPVCQVAIDNGYKVEILVRDHELATKQQELASLNEAIKVAEDQRAELVARLEQANINLAETQKILAKANEDLRIAQAEIARLETARQEALKVGDEAEVARLEALKRLREAEAQTAEAEVARALAESREQKALAEQIFREGQLAADRLAGLQEARTSPEQPFVDLPSTRFKEPLDPLQLLEPITTPAMLTEEAILAEAPPEEEPWKKFFPWVVIGGAFIFLMTSIGKIWRD